MTISLVIISYNSEKFICDCLDSALNQTVFFDKIIVVDNNSIDNTVEIVEKYKNIDLVKIKYNSGYSKAANIGIAAIISDYCVIANSDIILKDDFVEKTKEYFKNNEKTDILSPLMLRFNKETIDSAGQDYSVFLYPKEIDYNKKINELELKERKIFSVCGAATVFKSSSLEKLKINDEYYDEEFFMFWEDFDIGWRANILGMNIVFFPEIIVYHYRSGTLKRNILSEIALSLGREPNIKYHLVKNRYLTLIKNFDFKKYWYHIPFIIVKDFLWVGMLTISSPKIIIKVIMSYKLIGSAYKKRKMIKQMVKRNDIKT